MNRPRVKKALESLLTFYRPLVEAIRRSGEGDGQLAKASESIAPEIGSAVAALERALKATKDLQRDAAICYELDEASIRVEIAIAKLQARSVVPSSLIAKLAESIEETKREVVR